MQILAVDDDPIALALLGSALAETPHTVRYARRGAEALALLRDQPFHMVITDWIMPDMDGVTLCRHIRSGCYGRYIYIIIVTVRDRPEDLLEALREGADDHIAKPFDPAVLRIRIRAAERALSLQAREVAVFTLARLAEWREPETAFHLERIRAYARILGGQLAKSGAFNGQVTPCFVENLIHTAPLHDIGKVGVPDAVLFKRGRLTDGEFRMMQQHTRIGAATLEAASRQCPDADYLLMARDIALAHHERFDGKGYPDGLSGDQIPLCARIVALADVYDAITSRRVYKKGYPHDVAREIIVREREKHFDPRVVAAFLAAEDAFVTVQVPIDPQALGAVPPSALPCLPPGVADRRASQPEQRSDWPMGGARDAHAPQAASHAGADAAGAVTAGATGIPAEQGPNPAHPLLSLLVIGSDAKLEAALCRPSTGAAAQSITVERAAGLEEARERAGTQHYDAVLLDLALADSGDMAVVRRLCSLAPDIPVIGVATARDEALARSVVRAGAQDCVFEEELDRDLLERSIIRAIERHRLLEEVRALSLTDELTGVYNRRGLFALAEQQLMLDARMGWQTGLLYADVDSMKQINDTQGHAAGDQALRTVADAMRSVFRASDIVARVGGDEFAVVAAHASERFNDVLGTRFQQALVRKHRENGELYELSVSVGTAVCSPGSQGALTTLLTQAEAAMYRAKRRH